MGADAGALLADVSLLLLFFRKLSDESERNFANRPVVALETLANALATAVRALEAGARSGSRSLNDVARRLNAGNGDAGALSAAVLLDFSVAPSAAAMASVSSLKCENVGADAETMEPPLAASGADDGGEEELLVRSCAPAASSVLPPLMAVRGGDTLRSPK